MKPLSRSGWLLLSMVFQLGVSALAFVVAIGVGASPDLLALIL